MEKEIFEGVAQFGIAGLLIIIIYWDRKIVVPVITELQEKLCRFHETLIKIEAKLDNLEEKDG